ncbi:MAG: hypothetical protein ACT4QD_02475 [Acidobacteriota bacterium]
MSTVNAAIGFAIKSGWAAVVVVGGPNSAPRIVDSRRLELSDPEIPESRQPYHHGFGTAREGGAELTRLIASVKRYGRRSVTSALREYETKGCRIQGAGLVVGSLIDPSEITNPHIRIHAMEGRLFREVVVDAAERAELAHHVWRSQDLYGVGAKRLRRPESALRSTVTAMGKTVSPWRAEQKAATLAAWLALVP